MVLFSVIRRQMLKHKTSHRCLCLFIKRISYFDVAREWNIDKMVILLTAQGAHFKRYNV